MKLKIKYLSALLLLLLLQSSCDRALYIINIKINPNWRKFELAETCACVLLSALKHTSSGEQATPSLRDSSWFYLLQF